LRRQGALKMVFDRLEIHRDELMKDWNLAQIGDPLNKIDALKNMESFKAFTLKYNTIEWENGADFAPVYLFNIGVKL